MNLKLRYVLVGLSLAMASPAPMAAECRNVFANAIGTTVGELELRDAATLTNTGNRRLATADLNVLGGSVRCDGSTCLSTGGYAAELVLPANGSRDDLRSRSVTLSAGDYYFEDVDLDRSETLVIAGDGQVRIHVGRDLRLRNNVRVNVSGDPLALVFLVGDDVTIEDSAQVNAVIYAVDRVEIKDDVRIEGAVVGGRARVRDDAQIAYHATSGLGLAGTCDVADTGGDIGKLNFKIEVGELTVIDTYAKPDFTRVNFTQAFSDPPLVFTLPTTDGANSAAHRIRNVDRSGFDIMTLEPDGEDGPHVSMALNYLAVEEGVHDLPGGRKLVAANIDTARYQAYGGGTGWESVSFGGHFSTPPAVLGQIQGMVNEQETRLPTKPSSPWLTTAIDDVTASGMRIALERSDSPSGTVSKPETIGYLAVEPVSRLGFVDSNGKNIDMEVIRSAEQVQGWGTCNSNPIAFSRTWPNVPVVLATKNTRDGDAGVGDGEGGWLRRCSTNTSDVRLQIDEVRSTKIGDGNRTHKVRERAAVVLFSGNFVMEARELDHFRLQHDGFGVAGIGETVTIKACRNADCSLLYTDSVTVTLSPGDGASSWSGTGVLANQVTFTGGALSVTLNRNAAGAVTLGMTATPTPKNATRCFVGAVETCAMTIAGTGFTITLPDRVSGDESVGVLGLPTCWDDFRSTTLNLAMRGSYLEPATPGPRIVVNGTSLPSDGSAATVAVTFDDRCSAVLRVGYADAGQVGLSATFSGAGALAGLEVSGSDTVVFYPAALLVTASNDAGVVLDATAAATGPVHVAGEPFTLAISAINAAGAVTRNYRPQSPTRLAGYLQRTGPLTGFDGMLSITGAGELESRVANPADLSAYSVMAIEPARFVNGVFSDGNVDYSEVGLVSLHLADSDYFGHAIAASAQPIGRFVPAAFQVTGTLVNRSATPGCSGAGFTYLGETLYLGVELMAVNAAGALTRNYAGDFAHFDGSGFSRFGAGGANTLGIVAAGTPLSDRLTLSSVGLGVPWSAGVATLDVELAVAANTTPDGPHDPVEIGIALSDGDGVGVAGVDLDVNVDGADEHARLDSTRLLHGRLAAGNAHGSELRDLDVPLAMQFHAGAGAGFVTHAGDDCTPLAAVVLEDVDAGDSLAVAQTCIVDAAGSSGGHACPSGTPGRQYQGTPSSGVYSISLKAPGAGRSGAVRVRPDGPGWAEHDWTGAGDSDPSAIVTFGIHNRDVGIIYQRDVR